LPTPEEYAQIGETAFKARDYKSATRAWRHAVLDDPQNGVLVQMLAQAMFATEQYNEAAGATQFGMTLLPKEKWETVVKNYRELYGKVDDYTNQLRTLEKAAREKQDDPAMRFLLGYHYGFLGFPKEAVTQLEKCVTIAPEDEAAQKLLDIFGEKLPKKEQPPVKPPTPSNAETKTDSSVPALNPSALPPPPAVPK
jgi:tetratricopeptide (TPR) repeat protein